MTSGGSLDGAVEFRYAAGSAAVLPVPASRPLPGDPSSRPSDGGSGRPKSRREWPAV